MSGNTLLEVRDLKRTFGTGEKSVTALDGVSFDIEKGETLGVVGESGCGKSTLGRCLAGILEPDSGTIAFNGNVRRQMIFQDPYNSVDPYWKVLRIVMEACGSKDKAEELLQLVGLSPQDGTSYPHELSGGQLQRVGIARALGSDPEFIVCDEPVSALDVSYQSKIITLLEQLQSQRGLTYMFISHDLAAVRHIADRIMIMYMGQIMEIGKTDEIITMPLHPYTRFLLSAVPAPFEKKETLTVRNDDEKSYGCPFASRCPFAKDHCLQFKPQLQQITENHAVACFHPGK